MTLLQKHIARLLFGLILAAISAPAQSGSDAKSVPNRPHPSLSPEQVVRAQLYAFKHNDSPSPNAGIRTAFGFASPANRKVTGPVDRFIGLVRNPQYQSLLNYKSETFEPIETNGEQAAQRVTVLDAKGKVVTFLFILSKQTEAPYRGCWMVDSVVPVEDAPRKIAENSAHFYGSNSAGGSV